MTKLYSQMTDFLVSKYVNAHNLSPTHRDDLGHEVFNFLSRLAYSTLITKNVIYFDNQQIKEVYDKATAFSQSLEKMNIELGTIKLSFHN